MNRNKMAQEFVRLVNKYQPENHPDIEVISRNGSDEQSAAPDDALSEQSESDGEGAAEAEAETECAEQSEAEESEIKEPDQGEIKEPDQGEIKEIKESRIELVPKKIVHRKLHTGEQIVKLRALTYNIWFDEQDRETRTLEIIRMIRKGRYDIIGLQEVVKETLDLISSRLKEQYHIFQVFITEQSQYGDTLLFRKDQFDIIEPYYYDYEETAMSRKIIGCEIKLKTSNKSFHVLNTHLESGSVNKAKRESQFATIEKAVVDYKMRNVILLGDFNITSTQEPVEDRIKQSIFKDSWIEMGHPNDLKYTYDSQKNSNIKNKFRARFDRILYAFEFEHMLTQIRLIGITEHIRPPSDHFGLVAEFVLQKNDR